MAFSLVVGYIDVYSLIPNIGEFFKNLSVILFDSMRASLVVQLVKNPPAMQEAWVQSLGWEEPLKKEKATHSSILAWKTPWTA